MKCCSGTLSLNKICCRSWPFVHEEETTRVSFTIPQGVKTFQADLVGDEVIPYNPRGDEEEGPDSLEDAYKTGHRGGC